MKNKIHLPIIIEQDEHKLFIVSCPTFKNFNAKGKTINAAMENIEKIIKSNLKEEKNSNKNKFIAFRELTLEVA
jgi:predicted RNase H-like HicB family nuclease